MGRSPRRALGDGCPVLVRTGALVAVASVTTAAVVALATLSLYAPGTAPRPGAFGDPSGITALEPLAPAEAPRADVERRRAEPSTAPSRLLRRLPQPLVFAVPVPVAGGNAAVFAGASSLAPQAREEADTFGPGAAAAARSGSDLPAGRAPERLVLTAAAATPSPAPVGARPVPPVAPVTGEGIESAPGPEQVPMVRPRRAQAPKVSVVGPHAHKATAGKRQAPEVQPPKPPSPQVRAPEPASRKVQPPKPPSPQVRAPEPASRKVQAPKTKVVGTRAPEVPVAATGGVDRPAPAAAEPPSRDHAAPPKSTHRPKAAPPPKAARPPRAAPPPKGGKDSDSGSEDGPGKDGGKDSSEDRPQRVGKGGGEERPQGVGKGGGKDRGPRPAAPSGPGRGKG